MLGQRVVAVSAGRSHNLAITADGAVWSWGNGAQYRLGHGDEQTSCCPRRSRPLLASASSLCRLEAHSLAITADGAVFTWGKGDTGCLGHGEDLSNQLLPKKIEAWALEQ